MTVADKSQDAPSSPFERGVGDRALWPDPAVPKAYSSTLLFGWYTAVHSAEYTSGHQKRVSSQKPF